MITAIKLGTRIRTKIEDSNDVERGIVTIPVGHCGTVEREIHDDHYAVVWDDNAAGEDMGWTIWTSDEILHDATPADAPEQEQENPNTNCLEGFQCPECGSFGPFRIDASVTVLVHDDGTEQCGDTEWEDTSRCICHECDHVATVGEFCGD